MVAMCTNWGGNAINSQTVQFLEQAGMSEVGAFDLNLVLNAQYLTFGLLCIWREYFGPLNCLVIQSIVADRSSYDQVWTCHHLHCRHDYYRHFPHFYWRAGLG